MMTGIDAGADNRDQADGEQERREGQEDVDHAS